MRRLTFIFALFFVLGFAGLTGCSDDDGPAADTAVSGDGAAKTDTGAAGDAAGTSDSKTTTSDTGTAGDSAASGDGSKPIQPQKIDPKAASDLINKETVVIVDLREPSELPATGVIKDALRLPYTSGTFAKDFATKLKKTDKIVLYCASGVRSSKAAQDLVNAGYTTVYDILGGMTAWKTAGLPTVAP